MERRELEPTRNLPFPPAPGAERGSGGELEVLGQRRRILGEIAALAVRCQTLNELSDALATLFRACVRTDAFLLDVYNPGKDELTPVGYYDTLDGRFQRTHVFPAGDNWVWSRLPRGSQARDKTVVILRTAEEAARRPPSHLGVGDTSRSSASLVFTPLIAGGIVAGCVSVQSYELNAYTPADVELIEEVCRLVAPTLHSLRLRLELEQQNRALASTDARIRAMLNAAHAAVALLDRDGVVIEANEEFCRRHGMDRAAMIHSVVWDSLPAEVVESRRARFLEVFRTGQSIRFVDERQGIWNETTLEPVKTLAGDVANVVVFAIDITAHRRALRNLQELEHSQHRLVESLNVGVYQVSGGYDARFLQANTATARILGHATREDILGNRVLNYYFHPDERRQLYAPLVRHGRVDNLRLRLRRRDGTPVIVSLTGTAELDNDGELVRYSGIIEDITARVAAEEQVQRLAAALEQLGESVVITDVKGDILYANRAFEVISGYSREEALGRNPRFMKSGEHSDEFYQDLWETILGGKVWAGRLVNRRKDGARIVEDATIAPIRDAGGAITHFVAVRKDVTHEIDAEARLRQAQKMEAIGVLAGGIAHDFNNILQGILGFAELARIESPPDSPLVQHLSEIETAGNRAAELVGQILAFSRKSEEVREPLSLGPIVKEALKLLRGTLPATISIEQHLNPACPAVVASAVQIHQVLINLATNAYHAMRENGGTLSVSLQPVTLSLAEAGRLPNLRPGLHIRLSVMDTGCGIPRENLERIFEPYFTTKHKEQGSGLGLATVHGIVLGHGGEITVESAVGKGSTFSVYLPAAPEAEPKPARPRSSLPSFKGTPRVMVVEDEEAVMRLLRLRLERLGARVEAHTNGHEALDVFRRSPDDFDVIVTDQTMPGMTGVELMREVHRVRPGIGVILCSGYSDQIDSGGAVSEGAVAYVSKPYQMNDLIAAINNAVRQTPPA